jgi:glycosyltransferase involved in cell wall biosynthesis
MESTPNYSVIVTSKDRPAILAETIQTLLRQSHPPESILVVVDKPSDMDDLPEGCRAMIFSGSLTAKRNAGMGKVPVSSSLLLFVDDDVELHRDYALSACELFASHREIVAASGNALVDAAIPRARAIAILAEARIPEWQFKSRGRQSVLYGCNMIIRREAALQERFDEALPLYSFGEDYEISIRLRRRGLVGRFSTGLLVHLKASSGRLNRKRLAWSIIANNWYFIRKGSSHLPPHLAYLRFAWTLFYIGREQLQLDLREKNSRFPGTRGILLATRHLLTGKLHPERLLELQ